jgi:hypothetical protein
MPEVMEAIKNGKQDTSLTGISKPSVKNFLGIYPESGRIFNNFPLP